MAAASGQKFVKKFPPGALRPRHQQVVRFFRNDPVFRDRFSLPATAILYEEGFSVHHRKTRIMRQSVRRYLAGLVVNQHPNIRRADFDRLKAMRTSARRQSASVELRDQLQGKLAFVESINPAKGSRLRELFEQIL